MGDRRRSLGWLQRLDEILATSAARQGQRSEPVRRHGFAACRQRRPARPSAGAIVAGV